MKTFRYLIYTIVSLLAAGLVSCTEEEFYPGEPELENCYGVYFPEEQPNATAHMLNPADPRTLGSEEGIFEVAPVTFEDGQKDAVVTVSFDKAENSKNYSCRLSVEDPQYALVYGQNPLSVEFSFTIIEWELVTGPNGEKTGMWSDVIYMPCTAENNFIPEFPKEDPDLIYLCIPNNPTGTTITKSQLQEWVDYANRIGAVIIYDAAYEAYITEEGIPHSIYECDGARTCAIEIRSFSKNAGFTGVRLGFTVVPKDLVREGVRLHDLWARRHGTKFNGAPYIVQKAGEAVYSPEGKAQLKEQVAYYMRNAHYIYNGLKDAGYSVSGGVNAPYIWLKTPRGMTSWEFFDHLLEKAHVVGTPGSGFGAAGEGYFRLTAFGSYENTPEAIRRIQAL